MSEDQYWAIAKDLLFTACENAPLGSPIYEAVTDGRQRKGYSSCGYLAHWMLFHLGVRLPWINRAEHLGWHVGENVMRLTRRPIGSNELATKPTPDTIFTPGDVIVVNAFTPATTHVSVVYSYDAATRAMTTGDYGQPHGCFRHTPVQLRNHKLMRGAREIHSHLRLADVLLAAEEHSRLEAIREIEARDS